MNRLFFEPIQELIDFPDTRRPRRSRLSSLNSTLRYSQIYERGVTGGSSRRRSRASIADDGDTTTTIRPSRFPAIIADHSVSYDPDSQLFTVSGLRESRGQAYYFDDLPNDIKAEIRKLRLSKPKR